MSNVNLHPLAIQREFINSSSWGLKVYIHSALYILILGLSTYIVILKINQIILS